MGDRLVARFEYGAQKFELETGRVTIQEGFVPPTTVAVRTLGRGEFESRVEAEQYQPQEWSFTVLVEGGGVMDARRALEELQTFLNRAGDPDQPVYFAFRDWGASFPHEPTWGQFGALTRYRVLQGVVRFGSLYKSVYTGNLFDCLVTLTIDPFSYGLFQAACTAGGSVFEEWAGRSERSVGVRVAAVQNLFTNPVFGFSTGATTFDTGWTKGTNIAKSRNADPDFLLFDDSSARLVSLSAASNTYTQSINVGNTNTHTISCYAKRRTGGVIDGSILSLYYGSAVTTRYLALEDGWYFLYGTVTGVPSATASGVQLAASHEVFVDGFQLERSNFPQPTVWGDLWGASWDGTAHQSETTGAGLGKLLVPAARNQARGTIQVVIQCMARSADLAGTNHYVFQDSGSGIALYYDKSNNRWTATNGPSSINSNATFTEGDIFVFHISWSSILQFYIGGTSINTAAMTPSATEPTGVYLGSDTSLTNNGPWVILGFDMYPLMADADVAAFAAQAAAITASKAQRVSPIPWLWTKDGDDILDNCDDSTRDNWGLIGGVTGDEVETRWDIGAFSLTSNVVYWLLGADFDYGEFQKPDEIFYRDLSGTADIGNASGDAYQAITADTTGAAATGGTVDHAKLLERGVDLFVRLKAASGQDVNVWGAIVAAAGATGELETERSRISLTTSYQWHYLGRIYYEAPETLPEPDNTLRYKVWVQTLSGTLATHVDFLMAVQRGRRMIYNYATTIANLRVRETGDFVITTAGARAKTLEAYGELMNLIPERYNLVWFSQQTTSLAHTITHTATVDAISLRPRWSLR